MKNTINFLTKGSVMLLIAFTLFSCNNDDDNSPPIDQLPEATQTGRGIFGALVNGEAFVETNTFFNTFYQQVDGEFFFSIRAQFEDSDPRSIALRTEMRIISEGETLLLRSNSAGNAYGECSFEGVGISDDTGTTMIGELTITKLDFQNNIVSGVFWFDLIHPETGERFEIREGRFDTLFTQ